MSSGYVLRFSNRTFEQFFREVVGVEIYDSRYDLDSGSKANRMRAFWNVAPDEQVVALLNGLTEAWDIYSDTPMPQSARDLVGGILRRLGIGQSATSSTTLVTAEPASLAAETSRTLMERLIDLTKLPPQERGYEFEKFLTELFDAYGLGARASFRLTGEQIDGSFVLHDETYLLEAKWENPRTGVADLHTFEGKLGEKASWSRGLFVSNSGFSPDGLQAFGRGKRVVCMDGYDISEMLRLRLSFVEVMDAKVRRAAETGSPFVPVRDIFPE